MKKLNLVSAVLAATVLATSAVQSTLPGGDSAALWRIGASWLLGALAWAVAFSLVRDGVRGTLSMLMVKGPRVTSTGDMPGKRDDAVVRLP